MKPIPNLRRYLKAWVAFLLALGSFAPAAAVTVNGTITGGFVNDSNLFLLSRADRNGQRNSGADNIYSVQGLMNAQTGDKVRGILATAYVGHDWFQHNKNLENTNYGASVTAQINGARGSAEGDFTFAKRLTPFTDIRTQGRALQTIFNGSAVGTHAVLGDFRILAGGDYSVSEINNPALGLNDYRRWGARGGFGYYSPTGNILAIEGRYSRASGDNRQPLQFGGVPIAYQADFTETSGQVHLLYAPSVLLSFDGRLGYARHKDNSGLAGSFSGLIGRGSVRWSPRQTVRLFASGSREFQSNSGVYSNGVRSTRFAANAVVDLIHNLAFNLQVEQITQVFRFAPQAALLLGARTEHILAGDAKLSWGGSSRVVMSADARVARRRATLDNFNYSDRRFTFTIGVKLGSDRRIIQPSPIS